MLSFLEDYLFGDLVAGSMNVLHDLLERILDLLEAPGFASGVLLHLKGRRPANDGVDGPSLFAYRTNPSGRKTPTVPASRSRAWMDVTTGRFASHCLPLKIANQAGEFILDGLTLRGHLGRQFQERLEAEQRRVLVPAIWE